MSVSDESALCYFLFFRVLKRKSGFLLVISYLIVIFAPDFVTD